MDINTTRLRCTLGWLATLLAWIVVILLWEFPPSISDTYFTYEAGPVFMIILGASSFLLISYKGYDKQDDVVSTIAGIFGLMICLFPTAPTFQPHLEKIGTFQLPVGVCSTIHIVSALIFFALLAYNSIFLFTKTNGNITPEKKKRNVIYRVCGVGMLASFLLMLLPDFYIKVWLVEMIALVFFGISWLTKASYYPWLFADKK